MAILKSDDITASLSEVTYDLWKEETPYNCVDIRNQWPLQRPKRYTVRSGEAHNQCLDEEYNAGASHKMKEMVKRSLEVNGLEKTLDFVAEQEARGDYEYEEWDDATRSEKLKEIRKSITIPESGPTICQGDFMGISIEIAVR